MPREMKKTTARDKREKLEKKISLVRAALDEGHSSRGAICTATGMKLWDLAELFRNNQELYSIYTVRRKTLVDMAADNIQDIIEDKLHPQHYAASKYVLQKYKSDLDSVLESADSEEFELDLGGISTASPVTIRFGKKKED